MTPGGISMAEKIADHNKARIHSSGGAGLLKAILVLVVAVLIGLALNGCGRKAPPKPPEGERMPPAVADLSGRLENGTLILSWTVPAPTEQYPLPVSGFDVLVSRQLSSDPCPNCPPNFKRAGQMKVLGNLESAAGSQPMQYRYPVEPGHRYTVVVISIADGGRAAGPESNTLKIAY